MKKGTNEEKENVMQGKVAINTNNDYLDQRIGITIIKQNMK